LIHKSLSEYSNEIEKMYKNVDDALFTQIQASIESNELALTLEEDYLAICQVNDALRVAQADLLTKQEAHKYREAVVKKLDSLFAMEESASHAIRERMISKVKGDVLKTFKTDKKIKEDALNQAIAVLAGGKGTKLGKDIVGEVFGSSLNNYKNAYAKMAPGSDAILNKLEADMAAVAVAPVVETKGGNVYETHPL